MKLPDEQALTLFEPLVSRYRFIALMEGSSKIQQGHHLPRQGFEDVALLIIEIARLMAQNADGSQRQSLRRLQRNTSIEAKVRLPCDQGIGGKAGVLCSVWDDKEAGLENGLLADRHFQGRLANA